jgi:hypothetical protein
VPRKEAISGQVDERGTYFGKFYVCRTFKQPHIPGSPAIMPLQEKIRKLLNPAPRNS